MCHSRSEERRYPYLHHLAVRHHKHIGVTMRQLSQQASMRLLYLIAVLDLLSLAISLPVLPRVFAHHGIGEVTVGYTAGAHSLLTFLVGPFLGQLSDQHGRVVLLQLSAVGTLVGCYLCANATTPEMFIVGRVLPGLFSCRLPVSQAYIADISTGSERSERFGTLMASFSIAFILGPLIGGALAKVHHLLPLHVSFFVCILHLLATVFLPEPETRTAMSPKPQSNLSIWQGPNARKLWTLAHIRVAFMIGRSLYETLFSQHTKHQFGFDGQQIGWMLSYIGLMSVLVNLFVVRHVSKHDISYLIPLAMTQSLGLLTWGVSTNLYLVLAAMALLALSNNCYSNILDSQVAELSSSESHGAIMSLCSSLNRITRILAPTLGGLVLHHLGAPWVGTLAAAITAYSVAVLVANLDLLKQVSGQEKVAKLE